MDSHWLDNRRCYTWQHRSLVNSQRKVLESGIITSILLQIFAFRHTSEIDIGVCGLVNARDRSDVFQPATLLICRIQHEVECNAIRVAILAYGRALRWTR